MTIFQGIILGLVQGLSEFLPISSSAHLIIAQNLFKIDGNMMAFDVFLHLGTLIPVCIVFWQEIWVLIKKPFQKMSYLIIIGTIPAVIATVLFGDQIDALFSGGVYLAAGFVITGILLLLSDKMDKGYKNKEDMTYLDGLIIGIIQAVAITPGISRSGSTIAGGLFRNLDKKTAAAYSFLLSIPAILGALVLQVKDYFTGQLDLSTLEFLPVLFGFLAAAVSGYIAIRFMLNLIRNNKLKYFSYYVFLLAFIILMDTIFFKRIFI